MNFCICRIVYLDRPHTPHSPFALPPLPPCLFLSLLCVCVCVCAVIEIFIFHLNCNNKTAEDICLNSRMAAGLNATAQQTSKHTHSRTHALKMPVAHTHTRAHCAHKGNCQFVVSFCLSHSFCQFVRLPICQKFCVNYEPKSTRCPFVAHTHTHRHTCIYTLSISLLSHSLYICFRLAASAKVNKSMQLKQSNSKLKRSGGRVKERGTYQLPCPCGV